VNQALNWNVPLPDATLALWRRRSSNQLTCPHCGCQATEQMPTDACVVFHDCKGCGATLRPQSGDCCVFCSYGSVPCPPVQVARAGGGDAACCGSPSHALNDWVSSARTSLFAWWLPQGAMVAALFASVPSRTAVWATALGWMGAACLLNARQCGRTHCRYTGPYYLAMIVPVLVASAGIFPFGLYGWTALGVFILGGGYVIWFATERAWGKFSTSHSQ
jgi:hypothetical protein